MIERLRGSAEKTGTNQVLDDLLEEIAGNLQSGRRADVEAYIAEHPEHAEDLRRLLPAMRVLAELGGSPGETSGPTGALEEDPHLTSPVVGEYRILREIGRGVAYSGEAGQAIRRKLDRQSGGSWTAIPKEGGH